MEWRSRLCDIWYSVLIGKINKLMSIWRSILLPCEWTSDPFGDNLVCSWRQNLWFFGGHRAHVSTLSCLSLAFFSHVPSTASFHTNRFASWGRRQGASFDLIYDIREKRKTSASNRISYQAQREPLCTICLGIWSANTSKMPQWNPKSLKSFIRLRCREKRVPRRSCLRNNEWSSTLRLECHRHAASRDKHKHFIELPVPEAFCVLIPGFFPTIRFIKLSLTSQDFIRRWHGRLSVSVLIKPRVFLKAKAISLCCLNFTLNKKVSMETRSARDKLCLD